jgi:DNA-binding CsgD family transcriptional regulator
VSASFAVLEREEDLETLGELLAGAAAGGGGAVVVEGSAGLGKTRLLVEVEARGRAAGLRVVRARGHELEREFAWGGCVQLVGSLLAGMPEDERAELLAGPGRPVAELLDTGGDVAALEVDLPLLHGIAWVLAGGGRRSGLLLLVDDVHWLDLPTLRALHFLLGRVVGVGGAMVLGRRTGEPSPGDVLLDQLAADPQTTRQVLGPLSPSSVATLVRARLPAAGDDVCAACVRACQGNPFLLGQLLDELGAETTAQQVDRLAPRAVADSVLVRLRRLDPAAVGLARAASVLPEGASLAVVAALAGLDPDVAADAAAALVRGDLLADASTIGFVHPLVRRAIERDHSEPELARAHTRAAELLHEHGASPQDVAAQLLVAAPGLAPWAVDALRRAAARALAHAAPRSAIAYLDRVLQEALEPSVRAAVLVTLGQAEASAGVRGADHLHQALEVIDDPLEQARLLDVLGWTLHRSGHFIQATNAFERGVRLAPDPELRRRLEAGWLVSALLSPEHQLEALEQAAALAARPAGELTPTERLVMSGILTHQLYLAEPHDGILARARELDVLGVIADEGADVHTVWHLIGLLSWTDSGEVEELLDAAFADARRRGSVLAFAMASYARSWPRYWKGRLDGAAADAQAAIDAWQGGMEMYLPAAAYWLVCAQIERGDLDAAARGLARVSAPDRLDDAMRGFVLSAAGRLAAARGDHAEALARQLECGALMHGLGMRNPAAMPWRSQAALSALALGDRTQAQALAADELAVAEAFGAPRPHGTSLRVYGLAHDDVDALRAAVALLDRDEARLDHLRAQVSLGAALRRSGARLEAREHLRAALGTARAAGARRLEALAHEELVAAGGRPRRADSSGPEALTPSERRVAALAARGRTNRDIAGELFVTVSTVEWHLKRAYAKLGIGSRRALAQALAQSDPGGP